MPQSEEISPGPSAPARSPIYHRLQSTTQTAEHAALQEQSGELWSRTNRGGHGPSVDAYLGPLPPGARGVEFTTDTPPDTGTPPGYARWTGPRSGVIVEGDFAKIRIEVTSNIQR